MEKIILTNKEKQEAAELIEITEGIKIRNGCVVGTKNNMDQLNKRKMVIGR